MENQHECIICYELIHKHQSIVFANCDHGNIVHHKCMMYWNDTCPLCRLSINNNIYPNNYTNLINLINYANGQNININMNNINQYTSTKSKLYINTVIHLINIINQNNNINIYNVNYINKINHLKQTLCQNNNPNINYIEYVN